MEWIKNNIKGIIGTIILVLSLVGGILALDDRYATCKDLAKLEQQNIKTFQEFKQQMDRDRLEQRYINLTDQALSLKILIKKYPKDEDLKEDYDRVIKEKEKVKEQLDKMRSQ
jgi:hypothetical protein